MNLLNTLTENTFYLCLNELSDYVLLEIKGQRQSCYQNYIFSNVPTSFRIKHYAFLSRTQPLTALNSYQANFSTCPHD